MRGRICQGEAPLLLGLPHGKSPRRSAKWVDDPDPIDLAPMRKVFGVQFATSQSAGGGEDGAVPERKAMRRSDFEGTVEHCNRIVLDRKAHPRSDESGGYIVRQGVRP